MTHIHLWIFSAALIFRDSIWKEKIHGLKIFSIFLHRNFTVDLSIVVLLKCLKHSFGSEWKNGVPGGTVQCIPRSTSNNRIISYSFYGCLCDIFWRNSRDSSINGIKIRSSSQKIRSNSWINNSFWDRNSDGGNIRWNDNSFIFWFFVWGLLLRIMMLHMWVKWFFNTEMSSVGSDFMLIREVGILKWQGWLFKRHLVSTEPFR